MKMTAKSPQWGEWRGGMRKIWSKYLNVKPARALSFLQLQPKESARVSERSTTQNSSTWNTFLLEVQIDEEREKTKTPFSLALHKLFENKYTLIIHYLGKTAGTLVLISAKMQHMKRAYDTLKCYFKDIMLFNF